MKSKKLRHSVLQGGQVFIGQMRLTALEDPVSQFGELAKDFWILRGHGDVTDSPHQPQAMGSGTEVTREAADVVLVGDDLMKLVEVLRVAKRMCKVIRQNFVGTLADQWGQGCFFL